MNSLKSSYYELRLGISDDGVVISTDHKLNIRVYPEGTPFSESWSAMQTQNMEYHYEKNDTLHNAVRPNMKVRITGLYLGRFVEVPSEQYKILYDGKGIELSATLLEICKTQKETIFEVEFDDGRREELSIRNPYLQ